MTRRAQLLRGTLALACVTLVLGASPDASAQLAPDFDLKRDETSSSDGFELYAGVSSAGRGGNELSGEPITGALGATLVTEFWSWGETAKVSKDIGDREAEFSFWPLFGIKWGVEAGAVVNGHLLGCLSCGGSELAPEPSRWQMSQWMRVHSGIFNIIQTVDHQPSAEFSDTYWRAERGVTAVGFGVEYPFMMRYEDQKGLRVDLQKMRMYGRKGWGTEFIDDLEIDVGATVVEVVQQHKYSAFVGKFIDVNFALYAPPASQDNTAQLARPMDVQFAFADMRGITFDEGKNTFGLYGGIRIIRPASLSAFDLQTAEDQWMPLEGELLVRFASRDAGRNESPAKKLVWRALDKVSYHVEAGTFHRIGPTGFGVDEGWKLQLNGSVPLGYDWSLRGEAVGVTARRIMAAPGVQTANVAGVETRFLLGRAEIGALYEFSKNFLLDLELWGERSDRFDPRPEGFSETAPGTVRFRMGTVASLTAKVF